MENQTTWRNLLEQFKHTALDQSGYLPDEINWSDKHIILNLLETRATEMMISLNSGIDISEHSVQTLRNVEVEELDRNDTPCSPASGCYWLRTKVPVPKIIKGISVTGIVANSDNPRFNFIKWDRIQYIPGSRIPAIANGRYWTIREIPGEGPYIYLYGDRFLESIAISAIWENPMIAEAFPVCGEVNLKAKCFPLDVDIYTDPWMRDIIMTKTWKKLLPVRDTAPDDKRNDDKHVDSRRVKAE